MKTLCIVPCGAKKIWDENPQAGPTPARDVYTGPFAGLCQEYAQRFYPDSWVILSAKYGFLRPEELVPGPYNVSFNDPKSGPVTVTDLRRIITQKRLGDFERIIVLGGKNYVRMSQEAFTGKEISAPLADCKGIGYMMGKLKGAIEAGEAIS